MYLAIVILEMEAKLNDKTQLRVKLGWTWPQQNNYSNYGRTQYHILVRCTAKCLKNQIKKLNFLRLDRIMENLIINNRLLNMQILCINYTYYLLSC